MITSIAIIILFGLLLSSLFNKFKLPGLLGMLILGIAIGPYALNLLSPKLLSISAELRKIALIIILLRAGLGLNRKDLRKVGITAMKLSFLPGVIEGFTIAIISTYILGFSFIEGGILGFIIAAVSPAVIVPQMLEFLENGIGTNKSIPTLILASASIDDVVAITIFTAFLGLYSGSATNLLMHIVNIPISIILGILLGLIIAILLTVLFQRIKINATKKVLLTISASLLLTTTSEALSSKIEIAGLLGVMTVGFFILEKLPLHAKHLSQRLNSIWIFAEILLFVLVGAEVNISVAAAAGLNGLIIIFIGLFARSIGVIIATWRSNLNWKERLFCIIAYTPKATVQAAIGAIPLGLGIPSGDIILALAVLSIVITAPLGAIGVKLSPHRLLEVESNKSIKAKTEIAD